MGQSKRKKTGTFKDYYRFPLMIDEYLGNVIAQPDKSGYMMAWDWVENEWISEYPVGDQRGAQLAEHIVRFLNGYTEYKPEFLWSRDPGGDPTIICMNGVPCMEIRGWGNLCSQWGLGHTKAAEIQDEFRDWIINKLNGNIE